MEQTMKISNCLNHFPNLKLIGRGKYSGDESHLNEFSNNHPNHEHSNITTDSTKMI